jgi:chromosome segregation protein
MHLKQIELVGFKSFYHKTKIFFSLFDKDFQKEKVFKITGIIGPNGSGKSNIADALKWALGTQSKKVFRSKQNKDIIFAGNSSKKALSSARVSVFIDNSNKAIPIEFSEVVITRRIFKDGENEYFLNDMKVSLKEIKKLLSKAGVGTNNYSIVDQGMADRFLVLNPEERKEVIDEASKIRHLQIKKDDSKKRLRKAKNNLEKSQAIMQEVLPRYKELEKKSIKIKQKKEFKKYLKRYGNLYFGIVYKILINQKKDLIKQKEELAEQLKAVETNKEKTKQALFSKKNQKPEAKEEQKEELAKIKEKLNQLRNKENYKIKNLTVKEGKLEILKEKIEYKKTVSKKAIDINYVEAKINELLEQIELKLKASDNNRLAALSEIKTIALKIKDQISQGFIENPKVIEEIEKLKQETDEILKLIKQDEIELKELKAKQEIWQDKIVKLNEEREKRNQIFIEYEEKIGLYNNKKDEIVREINDFNIKLAKLEVKEEDLKAKALKIMQKEIEKMKLTKAEFEEFSAIKTKRERDQYLEKLEEKIESLLQQLNICENINEEVLKEYKQIKKKYFFLKKETADLVNTIDSLNQLIKKLDKKIHKRFDKKFEEINRHFNHFFSKIFQGGTAQLKLEEMGVAENQEENPMGIDVEINIPGKKIQNINMLSGGEKTLISLAMLFALIKSAKPPFVLLDEVDAALDEINSAKFIKLVKEMAAEIQFMIITHNREVIKEMELLYGITMQEKGISNILSLNLQKNEKEYDKFLEK